MPLRLARVKNQPERRSQEVARAPESSRARKSPRCAECALEAKALPRAGARLLQQGLAWSQGARVRVRERAKGAASALRGGGRGADAPKSCIALFGRFAARGPVWRCARPPPAPAFVTRAKRSVPVVAGSLVRRAPARECAKPAHEPEQKDHHNPQSKSSAHSSAPPIFFCFFFITQK